MLVRSLEELDALIDRALVAGTVAFDTETTSLNTLEAELVGFSMCPKGDKEGSYVSLRSIYPGNLDPQKVEERLERFFACTSVQVLMHNAKYDIAVLNKAGLADLRCMIYDTMIASWLVNENRRRHRLKELVKSIFKYEMTTFKEASADQDIREIPPEEFESYASDDAFYTLRLWEHFEPQLHQQEVWQALARVEMPLVPLLADMHRSGVRIRGDMLATMRAAAERQRDLAEIRVREVMGPETEYNINSAPQTRRKLFEEMKLPVIAMTEKGAASTGKFSLEILRDRGHQIAADLLEYRAYEKTLSSFLPSLEPGDNGLIYPEFRQIGTVTGRFSSAEPNMQNFPAQFDVLGMRALVIPYQDDEALLMADYNQIELVFMAHFSQDDAMLRVYREGGDIHQQTVDGLAAMGVHITRDAAKRVNFGIIFGIGPNGLMRQIKRPVEECRAFINGWFQVYPGAAEFINWAQGFVIRHGYVRTISGRKRRLPEVWYDSSTEEGRAKRGRALRQAVNTIIQGSAADLMKLALVKLYRRFTNKPPCRIISTVHDETISSVRGDIEAVGREVKEIMETAVELRIPIRAEAVLSNCWLGGKVKNIEQVPEYARDGFWRREV